MATATQVNKKTKPRALRIFIIAGEQSGDALGGALIHSLRQLLPDVRLIFEGVGGTQMRAEGMTLFSDMDILSVMGFFQVIPRLRGILRFMNRIICRLRDWQPDLVITIDSPSFVMRLASRLRSDKRTAGLVLLHYVAPSVWAWKAGRAKRMARLYDYLLTLLPFEPPYFERHGLRTFFVGHPSAWNTPCESDKTAGMAFRQRYGFADDSILLCLCPGSRPDEIKRHIYVMAESLRLLRRHLGKAMDIRVVLVAARGCEATLGLERYRFLHDHIDMFVREDDKWSAFAASDMALAVSGTVSLDLARYRVPMVIIFAMDVFSAFLVRRLVTIRYASLLNIIADKAIIPEFLMSNCRSDAIAARLHALLKDHDKRRQQTQENSSILRHMLVDDKLSPSQRAAEVVKTILLWQKKKHDTNEQA